MATFREMFASAWRDYVTDGVPASGENEPAKIEIRAIGPALDVAFENFTLAVTQLGAGVYETKADLDATLSDSPPPALNDTAVVLADTNSPPENGWYKVESGPAWVKFADLTDSQAVFEYVDAQVAAEAATREAADDALDARLTTAEGEIESILSGSANAYTATRVSDRLANISGLYRNYITGSLSNKAINTLGELVTAAGRFATDFIEVTALTSITRFGSPVTSGTYVPFAFYDSGFNFLGYAWTGETSETIYSISAAPAGTKYVRLSATNATIEYYVYEPRMVTLIRDMMFSLFGTPNDAAGNLTNQYVNKSTGALANSSSYRMTPSLPVTPDTYLSCQGGLITNTSATQCQAAFYADAAVIISIASPAVIAQAGHSVVNGRAVTLTTTGALPTGLAAGTTYYAVNVVAGVSYQLSATVGGAAINTSGTQSGTHTARAYLGHFNPLAVGQTFRVGDLFPAATSALVIQRNGEVGAVYIIASSTGLSMALDMVASGEIVDYFAPSLVEDYRLTLTGGTTQREHAYWRTTKFIPVVPGQVFYVSAQDVSALGAVIAGYTAAEIFVENLLVGATGNDFVMRRVVVPAGVHKIRATYRNDVPPFALLSVRAAQAELTSTGADVVYLAPRAAYGRVNEPVFIMARGIVGDRAVPVGFAPDAGTFDEFYGDEKLRVTKSDAAAATVKIQAAVGSKTTDITTMALRLTDTSTAVSPAVAMNIVVIGDSTTSQLATGDGDSVDGDGTWVNEMSRQLTGIGLQALSTSAVLPEVDTGREMGPVVAGDIRAPLALSNIYFRGTRGTGIIKHEGRGGWHPSSYLDRTDAIGFDGKSNAFWDPGLAPWTSEGITSQFSMKYYIEHNNFDVASIASGVLADGSNLLVILDLGWNPYGNQTGAGPSASHMQAIMDRIHLEYPNAKVWVMGLQAPPNSIVQSNASDSTEKYYTAAMVFRDATQAYGEAYRGLCEDPDRAAWATFIQTSHQIDPDYAFSRSTRSFGPNTTGSSFAVTGTASFVHMRRRGYDAKARIGADAFLYHYCRPAPPPPPPPP